MLLSFTTVSELGLWKLILRITHCAQKPLIAS